MSKGPGTYWSSCCGLLAEYSGYYWCKGCKSPLHMGREQNPHLLSDPHEARRIQAQREAAEAVGAEVDDRALF